MSSFFRRDARAANARSRVPHLSRAGILAAAGVLGILPAAAFGCACGCGVFDVGTASMFPTHSGVLGFIEYDGIDQDRNWSGSSRAPAADNTDKHIKTDALNTGIQYQINREWGVAVEVPYLNRSATTEDMDTGIVSTYSRGAVGDIRIKGIYTGFSPDMSTGITFGIKFANADHTDPRLEADTQIGSGSTDVLLGAYHLGNLTDNKQWRYFLHAQWDEPVSHASGYRPGREVNGNAGAYYEGWALGPSAKIAPVLQVSASYRGHDSGEMSMPDDTGYSRVLLTPGLEVDAGKVTAYLDVGLPLYTNVRGNQVVSSQFWRLNLSYRF
jgi:hypothetical protein